MFGRRYKLFTVSDIKIQVDLSWLIIAFLVTWTLAVWVFPRMIEDAAPATYWLMGAAGAAALFLSIIVHELAHALVARRYGLPVKSITLFVFGGVAEMQEEPQSPKAEFLMAGAGPLMSIGVALLCFGLYAVGQYAGWPEPALGVLGWLGLMNAILVAFNLIPGFPLDGGRLLRAGLWHYHGNLRRATRTASTIGSGFGAVLIGLGIVSLVLGDLVGGLWWVLIGMFLRNVAQASYRQLLIRQSLEGTPVGRVMNTNVVAVDPQTPLDRLVEDFLYAHHYKMFPVVEQGRLVGCVSIQQVKDVPREQWRDTTVGSIVRTCGRNNTVSPQTDALKVLSMMNRSRSSRVMVAEGDHLMGIVTLRDLMRFLSIKMELEEGGREDVSVRELASQDRP